jgi:hypothetical protein
MFESRHAMAVDLPHLIKGVPFEMLPGFKVGGQTSHTWFIEGDRIYEPGVLLNLRNDTLYGVFLNISTPHLGEDVSHCNFVFFLVHQETILVFRLEPRGSFIGLDGVASLYDKDNMDARVKEVIQKRAGKSVTVKDVTTGTGWIQDKHFPTDGKCTLLTYFMMTLFIIGLNLGKINLDNYNPKYMNFIRDFDGFNKDQMDRMLAMSFDELTAFFTAFRYR